MPGPQPKPEGRRLRRNRRPALTVEVGSRAITPLHSLPSVPVGVGKSVAAEWRAFWGSEYAVAVKWRRDGRAISRLFQLYELHDRFLRATLRRPLVPGSQKQPVENPLTKRLAAVDAEIRQLEDRFGLNTRAAMQMGVVFTDLQKSLDELTRDANDDSNDDEAGQGRIAAR